MRSNVKPLIFAGTAISNIFGNSKLKLFIILAYSNDGDFRKGIHIGEDLYENDGFIVHFFSKDKVKSLLKGFENISIDEFEEDGFPRKLYLVVNKKL